MTRLAALALSLLWSCGAPPEEAARTERCATCHRDQAAGWASSRHGQSGTSPVFVALLPHVERAWGPTARARCVACHNPGFVDEPGIGCASCHLAIGNRGERDGALVVKPEVPIATRAVPAHAPHATEPRAFFLSASLCGTCHEVHGPGLLEEPTLSEYRASPDAAADECVSCHFDGHRFTGLEPAWGASPEEAEASTRASLALLQRALHLELDGATVTVRNVGAAHAVPTGMTAMRDVWVDVTVRDEAGVVTERRRVMELGAQLGGAVLFTDATAVTSRSLPARAHRSWTAPPGSVVLRATLSARAYRDDALEALGLAALRGQVPHHVIATLGP